MSVPTSTNPITQSLTDTLAHLVQMPTLTADTATNRAALDWIETQLAGLPLHIQRYEFNGHPSLVATTPAAGRHQNSANPDPRNPRLWLTGHLDVVPGSTASFKPQVRDGRLYGRGTHDMKCGLAVYLVLLQQLGPKLAELDLGLMITTDEEIGGYDGVKRLLDDGYRGAAAFMPDSGASWRQETGSKGVTWWDITATGSAAHASRPWEGTSAIDNLIRFTNLLREHFVTEPCNDPKHSHSTLNLGVIKGGTVANQVADHASARLDIRIAPDSSISEISDWVEAARSQVPGIKVEPVLLDPPYQVNSNGAGQLFYRLATAAGHTINEAVAHGSSDARFFAAQHIPTINVSPTGSGFHVPHEWIDLDDLAKYYQLTHQFVTDWCTAK